MSCQELLDGGFAAAYEMVMARITQKAGTKKIPFLELMKKLKPVNDFKEEYVKENTLTALAVVLAKHGDFRGNIWTEKDEEARYKKDNIRVFTSDTADYDLQVRTRYGYRCTLALC